MNSTLKTISVILFLSSTPLFCMQGRTRPLVKHIAQKLWHIVRPTDQSAQLDIVIGTIYTTTTWLILPTALYYFDYDSYEQHFKRHVKKHVPTKSSSNNQNQN